MRSASAIILALLCLAGRAAGQLVDAGTPLRRIETGRFDIYFPPALESDALRLAAMADGVLDSLAPVFPGATASGRRFPVMLADGSPWLNGYFTPAPSNRIVLYAAPARIDEELGAMDELLRGIFTHELVHALSYSTRSGFWSLASLAFGDLVAPIAWMASPALIEGVAVALEGISGSGRASDPMTAALVRQDIIEGSFKTFWQASNAWDAYPYGRLRYYYGGLFTAQLLERYGYDAMAEFWSRAGEGSIFPGLEGWLFLKGGFEKTFGLGLDEAWEEFRSSIALREPIVLETERLSGKPGYITAMAAGRDRLYWCDSSAGAVMETELTSGRTRRLFAADGRVERLDAAADGFRLLVSWTREIGGSLEHVAKVWDLDALAFTGEELRGLREAAFAGPEAFVGIRGEGYVGDLVLIEPGSVRTLAAGSPGRSFGSPSRPGYGRFVYCLERSGGETALLRVEVEGGAAARLAAEPGLSNPRFLSASPDGKRLAFGFAQRESLYRLALVELGDDPRLLRQGTALSGSVYQPVVAGNGEVYYVGRFTAGEYPCRYPADNPALSLVPSRASWEMVGSGEGPPSEAAPGAAASGGADGPAPGPYLVKNAGLLPLALRTIRLPSISEELDAAGLALAGEDISSRLAWSLDAQYGWAVKAANLRLGLDLGLRPWRIGIGAEDVFQADYEDSGYFRRSSATVSLGRSWSFLPARRSLTLALAAGLGGIGPALAGSAYVSGWSSTGAAFSAGLRYSSYRGGYFPPFASSGAGLDLGLDAERLFPDPGSPPARITVEAGADASLTPLGLRFLARAAFSPDGSIVFGCAGKTVAGSGENSILEPRYPPFGEYASSGLGGAFYAFGEASAQLLSLEIQKRVSVGMLLSPLYARRLELRAGLRGAALALPDDPSFLSSAFARAELAASPLIGSAALMGLRLGAEARYAFDSLPGRRLSIVFVYDYSL